MVKFACLVNGQGLSVEKAKRIPGNGEKMRIGSAENKVINYNHLVVAAVWARASRKTAVVLHYLARKPKTYLARNDDECFCMRF